MEEIKELRVHGVSGTPPRDMLYTDPIPRPDGDEHTRVFKRRPIVGGEGPDGRPYESEAFHWGSLTTGHWLTSLWVLLAPFALANVAGWMGRRRGPAQRSMIRLAGLALTGLFVVQGTYLVTALPADWIAGQRWGSGATTLATGGAGLAIVLLFGALVLRLSTQSHFDPLTYRDRFRLLFSPRVGAMKQERDDSTTWEDPGSLTVDAPEMWQVHSIVHRLRRIHFAAGQLVIALALARIAENEPLKILAIAGLVGCAFLIVTTSVAASSRITLLATAWSSLVAEAVALATVLMFALSDVLALSSIHRTTFHIAIVLGVAGGLSIIGGIPSVGALTFAVFTGGALGVGAGLIGEDLLGVDSALVANGGAWVAPASLIFVLFVALVAVGFTFVGPPPIDESGFANRLLTRLTRRSRPLLATAAGFGLVAGLVAILAGCVLTPGLCQPDALRELSGADATVLALLISILLLLALRLASNSRLTAAVLAVAALVVAWVGLSEPMWGSFAPSDYLKALPLARTLIFVAPVAAIGRSVLGAYRQGASSRKVGVIWDVVSFWPRWFHPLGPPAYGPNVVTSLHRHIVDDETDVLAAHSQGSVIAAVATYQAWLAGDRPPPGLLTYGSPISMLYSRLFPDVGMEILTRRLPARLDQGWINLTRVDDPIGGIPLGGAVESVTDDLGSGHSGYELTASYREARDRLVAPG